MKLTNNAGRALGVPGAHGSLIIESKASVNINPADLEAIKRNRTARGWLSSGLISVDGDDSKQETVKPKKEPKQELENDPPTPKPTGEVEIINKGRGWFQVVVAGIEVSQGNLRKADAEALAAQYKTDEGDGED